MDVASSEQTMIAINSVVADRADEFEEWLRSVFVPVVNDLRPELRGRWRALRATEVEDGVVVFAFVCEGESRDDWALEPVLREALGEQGAADALATFAGFLKEEQRNWFFTPVTFEGA